VSINKQMNIVIEVETDIGVLHVHSTPITLENFERHYLIMSKTWAALYGEGLGAISGPRVSYLMLKDIATSRKMWDGQDGVKNTLVAEIIRLSNVALPDANGGWRRISLDRAHEEKMLGATEMSELLGALVFFTLASAIQRGKELLITLAGMNGVWGTRAASWSFTEYVDSLQTSTEAANTGEMAETTPLSSVPH